MHFKSMKLLNQLKKLFNCYRLEKKNTLKKDSKPPLKLIVKNEIYLFE